MKQILLALAILAVTLFAGPMHLAYCQVAMSHGECTKYHVKVETLPDPANCDSPCPTTTCGANCSTTVGWADGTCTGTEPDCFWVTVAHLPLTICDVCVCDNQPVDPRCSWNGHQTRGNATG